MSMFMDIHKVSGATLKDVAEAHTADIKAQGKYDVDYLKYWFNEEDGKIFCLCRAPTADAAQQVHREAHGLLADSIIKVDSEVAEAFLGDGEVTLEGDVRIGPHHKPDTAIRTILFTDIVGSTSLTQSMGDIDAMELVILHDTIVRNALVMNEGREIKHTGDGIMAAFLSAESAMHCAARIQFELSSQSLKSDGIAIQVRIGAATGEPVERHNDLYGATVQLAARLCAAAQPEEVLVAESLIDMCKDKDVPFVDRGELTLKGFDEPQHVASLNWKLGFGVVPSVKDEEV